MYQQTIAMRFLRLGILLLAFCAGLSPVRAQQASFQGLGYEHGVGFTNFSQALGISSDGKSIVGQVGFPDGTRPVLWDDHGRMYELSTPPGFIYSYAYNTADAARLIVGASSGHVLVWTAPEESQTLADFLQQQGVDLSGAEIIGQVQRSVESTYVSADGTSIIGAAKRPFTTPWGWESTRLEIFRWSASGGLTWSGGLSNDEICDGYSAPAAVSNDGSVVVGWSVRSDCIVEAVRWTGGGLQGLGFLSEEAIESWATAVSPDGSVVVGVDLQESTDPNLRFAEQAFRWTEGAGMIGLGYLDGSLEMSTPLSVSGDGSIVVGYAVMPDGPDREKAFIWTEADGMRSLEAVLQENYGLDLNGWHLSRATGISADGTVIVGSGRNPEGKKEAWRAVLGRSLAVKAPAKDEHLLPGSSYEIRWTSSGLDLVDVYFSTDDGITNTAIVTDYPADSLRYEWVVPDTLCLKCRITVMASDYTLEAMSERFKVRGYVLARVRPDSTYELFHPALHGWSFSNSGNNIWPESWWSRFDYAFGKDPHTNESYPFHFVLPPMNARAADFPDWPLFVQTFGPEQCYLGLFPRFTAMWRWGAVKGDWGGSCFGMATSSALAFAAPSLFAATFPEAEAFTNLVELTLDPARKGDQHRMAVNQMMTAQYGRETARHVNQVWNDTPNETLRKLKDVLASDGPDASVLYLRNHVGGAAHAVLPYRIDFPKGEPHVAHIYIYDNNNPFDASLRIRVDTMANGGKGNYTRGAYGGRDKSQGMFLYTPAVNYAFQPTLAKMASVAAGKSARAASTDYVEVYVTPGAGTRIENAAGEAIGFSDGLDFGTISGGHPIIPPTDAYQPPIGYFLPADAYTIWLTDLPDTLVQVDVFGEERAYRYHRSGAAPAQSDVLTLHEGLSVRNPNDEATSVNLEGLAVTSTEERAFSVLNGTLAPGDSFAIRILDGQHLEIRHGGGAKTYDLLLQWTSEEQNARYDYGRIRLAEGTTHRIVPDWTATGSSSIDIFVDTDGDGMAEDTLRVGLIGTADQPRDDTSRRYALEQNRPNPFSATTRIEFELPAPARVRLAVYNALGQEIAVLLNELRAAGSHEVEFNAGSLPSGVYFYRLESDAGILTRRMILVR